MMNLITNQVYNPKRTLRLFLFLIITMLGYSYTSYSQKKVIDLDAIDNWPTIQYNMIQISNDGKYISYPFGTQKAGMSLIVQSTDHLWKRDLGYILGGDFTQDGRNLIFLTRSHDSVGILDLKKDCIEYIRNAIDMQLPEAGIGRWMVCTINDHRGIVLADLFKGTKRHFANIISCQFNRDGTILVMQSAVGNSQNVMILLNLENGIADTISHHASEGELKFDEQGKSLAFLAETSLNSQKGSNLFYYKEGMDSAKMIAGLSTHALNGMSIENLSGFTKNGDMLYLHVAEHTKTASPKNNTKLKILNYQDPNPDENDETKFAYIDLINNYQLNILKTGKNEQVRLYISKVGDGDCVLTQKSEYPPSSTVTANVKRDDWTIFSVKGKVKKTVVKNLNSDSFLPSIYGKYLYWFNIEKQQWYTFNIAKKITKCISCSIPASFNMSNDNGPIKYASFGIAGWMLNDSDVLIYDRYDIWKVDPENIRKPVNLTGGYGLKNHIILRCFECDHYDTKPIKMSDPLMLWGISERTKMNSIFQLSFHSKKLTLTLCDQNKTFCGNDGANINGLVEMSPIKAKNTPTYLFTLMGPTEYANLHFTYDFKNFEPLTDLHPEKTYNWFVTELIHWKKPDATIADGILYKPENFDPQKKYPIIFYYYQNGSSALNSFINPNLCDGRMNIPWFVSQGYLVFIPDITYRWGHPGESVVSSVVSAANILVKLPYVDAKHMGLQGHSYGGFETNYLVSRTGIFAAAAPAEAVSDMISYYLEELRGSYEYSETGQGKIGSTIWQRPDLYEENSPIMKADKVTTPILILANEKDGIVEYSQGKEWFDALKRFHKKAWLLSYFAEDHTIADKKNREDYTVRLTQFFDHYLKGSPAPKWMTEGGTSLELDTSGKKP